MNKAYFDVSSWLIIKMIYDTMSIVSNIKAKTKAIIFLLIKF